MTKIKIDEIIFQKRQKWLRKHISNECTKLILDAKNRSCSHKRKTGRLAVLKTYRYV